MVEKSRTDATSLHKEKNIRNRLLLSEMTAFGTMVLNPGFLFFCIHLERHLGLVPDSKDQFGIIYPVSISVITSRLIIDSIKLDRIDSNIKNLNRGENKQ